MSSRCWCSRRDFLVRGMSGIGVGAGLPLLLSRTSAALTAQALQGTSIETHPNRILVVIELSGGNDGLNTVVPFSDPAYYKARPKLGIAEREVIKVADGFGFHPSMVGFERLYKDGRLAVVHGCGYDHPSLSHFSSMGFWHTGVPNGGEPLGWLGRLADETYPAASKNVIVNLGNSQSLAVRARQHSPLVFDDPARFRRDGTDEQKHVLAELSKTRESGNATLDFLGVHGAERHGQFGVCPPRIVELQNDRGLRPGWRLAGNLQRVAALVAADMPTRLYYVTYQGNSFDTHVQQADLHTRLLMYTADALRGFMDDVARLGRGDDVAVMIFTESDAASRRTGASAPTTAPRRRCSWWAKASKAVLRPASKPDRSG